MKKIFYTAAILFSLTAAAQTTTSKKQKVAVNKYNDNIDDRMKGPNGEKVYIGPNGGRYYIKKGNKIYIVRKSNKRKKI
jgi:colicin import membrane protein